MTDTIDLNEWLKVIDDEYLSTFVRDGGSAIKFAIGDNDKRCKLSETLKSRCEALEYIYVDLDAVSSRAHMLQDIFFDMARQIDWQLLARRIVLDLLRDHHYKVQGIYAHEPGSLIEAVAEANGLTPKDVISEFRPILANRVHRNSVLVKPFRSAMFHLCTFECSENSTADRYPGEPILDWLTGREGKVGGLKVFGIHTRIDKTTARYFIESTCHWVRQAGHAGTVVLIDNSHVTVPPPKPRPPNVRYYTKPMIMEHYEVLREFIDNEDGLPGVLLVVASSNEFLDSDPSGRGLGIYEALQTRIMDDVRDRNVVNPLSALIRIS